LRPSTCATPRRTSRWSGENHGRLGWQLSPSIAGSVLSLFSGGWRPDRRRVRDAHRRTPIAHCSC
jgi:hypothetical protein